MKGEDARVLDWLLSASHNFKARLEVRRLPYEVLGGVVVVYGA